MAEKKKLSFLGKDDEHIIKRNVIHTVQSSASYRIGNTQVVCGITSEIKQHIQDGTKPKIFDIRLENSGLCEEKTPVINTISTWIDEIINDDELFANKSKLIVETDDEQTCYYQRIHLVLYIIDDDGKVFDAAIFASIASLLQLKLQQMVIGNDGLCSYDEKSIYTLMFNYHPIPFTLHLTKENVLLSNISFILTENEINHVHIHGGKDVISPDTLMSCIKNCRNHYEKRKKELLQF